MFSISNISYCYQKDNVLKDVSFELKKGDYCAIIGPNGSGKTTLLHILSGALKKQEGEVYILGKKIENYDVRALAKQISVVPQRSEPVYHFSVFDMVMFGRHPYQTRWNTYNPDDEEIVVDALKKTNLLSLKDRMTSQLSGGEFQRTLIARAIAQQAPLMLLDEPLANLDIPHQFEILEILSELNHAKQTTILMVIHDVALAMQAIPKSLLLKNGRVTYMGDTQDICRKNLIFNLFDLDESFEVDAWGNVRRNYRK
ncbi:MAG: ABC transporter ATP-binding protein [Bacteroidetes bacterium]|nr:ABC transporter ATP-binding protein [Bacteroidota bacterium]MCL2303464.1 ABC transporter ATP-binding protein [Lentimicrobiaceae bacterium]